MLLGAVAAEIALRFIGLENEAPVVRYTIQRNSGLFSPTLDDSSPLFYTYDGIQFDGKHIKIRYPDRRSRIVPLVKPEGTFRIAAVGDSLTEQWGLPGYANYTNYLEELLEKRLPGRNHEVLPLGIGGYTTWQQRHYFERYLSRLETDVLLLQYCANDGDVMTLRLREPGAPVPENEWPAYEIAGERFGRPDYSVSAIGPIHSRLLWLIRHRLSSSPALYGHHQVAGNDQQRKALVWFRDLAAARKIPLLVAIFPRLDDSYPQPESRYIKKLLSNLGIDHFDVLLALKASGPLTRLARDRYHPTNEGHRLVARAILDHLVKVKLLPQD